LQQFVRHAGRKGTNVRLLALWERPHTAWGWFATVDHKEIGRSYLVTTFVFFLIGGVEALIIRLQLARPDAAVLTPEAYDHIFTLHGMTMIFWCGQPTCRGSRTMSFR
jgi:cytochrome c oxidase subunit 1/cytochrome c oxidase subunit I+III